MTKTTEPVFGLDILDTVTNSNDGVWCPITLPNGNPALSPAGTAIRIKLRGVDSSPYQEAMLARTRIAVAAAQKRKPGQATAVTDGTKESIDIIVPCVCGWEGFETPTSTADSIEPIPCVETNVRLVMGRYPLIRDQVDRFMSDRTNFLLVPLPT